MRGCNQFCSQVCKLLLCTRLPTARCLWKPSVCHQPHSTWRHRSTLCAPMSPDREEPHHASLVSRWAFHVQEPICLGSAAVWHLGLQTPPSASSLKRLQLPPFRDFSFPPLETSASPLPWEETHSQMKGWFTAASPCSLNWPGFISQFRSQCLRLYFSQAEWHFSCPWSVERNRRLC